MTNYKEKVLFMVQLFISFGTYLSNHQRLSKVSYILFHFTHSAGENLTPDINTLNLFLGVLYIRYLKEGC